MAEKELKEAPVNAPTGNNDASKVTAFKGAVGAYAWSAPLGTVVPDAIDAELDPKFECLGLISSDGISTSMSTESEDSTDMSGDIIHSVIKSRKETYKAKFVEYTNKAILSEVFGAANVTEDTSGADRKVSVKHSNAVLPGRVYVFDYRLDNGGIMREVIPNGKVTEIGESKRASGEIAGHEITITCGLDTAGYTAYTYIKENK